MEKEKILIIGAGGSGTNELALQAMREKYGNNIEIYTVEEAQKAGLKMEDFGNIPTMQIKNTYIGTSEVLTPLDYKDGKSKRREKRAEKRKK